ncbi:hypothetical protein PsorP6_019388 [Peronosclerospora sorghi]|nr:hypothetical protein PsorP6_019388 [Peronosclerospora sorghi]
MRTLEKAKTARDVFETEGAKYHVKFHGLQQEEDSEAPKDASSGPWQLLRDETNGLSFLFAEIPVDKAVVRIFCITWKGNITFSLVATPLLVCWGCRGCQ